MSITGRIAKLEAAAKGRYRRGVLCTLSQFLTWLLHKASSPNLSPRLAKFLERAMATEDDPLE